MTIISVLGFPLYKLHILCSFFYCFAIFFLRIHKIGFGQNEQLPHSNSFLNFVPGALYWKESFNLDTIKSNPFFFFGLMFCVCKIFRSYGVPQVTKIFPCISFYVSLELAFRPCKHLNYSSAHGIRERSWLYHLSYPELLLPNTIY